METDWKPSPALAGVTRPDDHLVGVIGWEFLVPADTALNDDDLLAEAVRLSQRKNFRKKRTEFHNWRIEATRRGATPDQFRRELEKRLAAYQEETAKARVRTTAMNAFIVLGAVASLVGGLIVPPVAIAAPILTIARVGVDKVWRASSNPETQAVAMFHDARKDFRWLKPS